MDGRRKGIVAASVVVAAAIVLVAWLGSHPPSGSTPVGPGSNVSSGNQTGVTGGKPGAQRQQVDLLAPPSSFPFVEKWVAQYNNGDHPGTVRVDYTDEVDFLGSGIYANASDFLSRHLADMVITGKPARAAGNFTYAGTTFLPVSPQAIAVVYNIPSFPDVPSGLKLDKATLYRILSGNITRWDDPAVKDLNPGVNLPGEAIAVVHEAPPKRATDLLAQYVNATQWPEKSSAAQSADSLSTLVRQMPYSVGYVEFTYAVQTKMTYAALENADGQYVEPSMESIGAAVRNGTAGLTADIPPAMSEAPLGNGSYPIVGLYYAAFDGEPENGAVIDFARWISGSEGQQVLNDMQYPSIYKNGALGPYAARLAGNATQAFNATNLTSNEGDSVYAQVAADGKNVYVAWQESTDDPPDNNDIFFRRSADGGATFANTINMSNNPWFSERPQLAVSGSNVYLAWSDDSDEVREVMLATSADRGRSFGDATVLSDPNADSYDPEIASAGGSVHVVWAEHDTNGSNAIVSRASSDSGRTFGAPVTVAEGDQADAESLPKVAAYGDSVHVVWSVTADDNGLYYARSTDRGASFSEPVLINGGERVGEAQVAAYGDDVHVAWGGTYDSRVDRLFHVMSSDGGKTFGAPEGLDSFLADPQNVELAIVPGDKNYAVYVAGQSMMSPGNEDILVAASADSGRTFSAPAANASRNPGISECPSIAVSDGSIYVTWEDLTPGNHDIFLARGRA